jgi:hypothetical protein
MPETTTEAPKARVKAVKAVKANGDGGRKSGVPGSYVVPLVGMRVQAWSSTSASGADWPGYGARGRWRAAAVLSVPAC